MFLNLYRLDFLKSAPARNHPALFIETHPATSFNLRSRGNAYNVTGTIRMGTVYRFREDFYPNNDAAFLRNQLLGIIAEEALENIDGVCKDIKLTWKQVDLRR